MTWTQMQGVATRPKDAYIIQKVEQTGSKPLRCELYKR